MFKGYFCVALPLLLLLGANAQESSYPRTPALRNGEIFGYERQLAQTFESLRRENNLPKLSRITLRQELDQLVCTAALNDRNPFDQNFPARLMYKTSDPVSQTVELKSIARYNQRVTPPDSRYALAIWPGIDKDTGRRTYWVGVEICTSAFFEFIDSIFTDNRPYRNRWKDRVALTCRDVQ